MKTPKNHMRMSMLVQVMGMTLLVMMVVNLNMVQDKYGIDLWALAMILSFFMITFGQWSAEE